MPVVDCSTGEVRDYSEEELAAIQADRDAQAEAEILTGINVDRETRIAGGFTFNGKLFQSAAEDRANIAGAAQLAGLYVGQGGSIDAVNWPGATPFVWIAADNSLVPMTPGTVMAFFAAGAAFKASQIFTARALKDAVIAAETAADKRAVYAAAEWPD